MQNSAGNSILAMDFCVVMMGIAAPLLLSYIQRIQTV